MITTSQRKQKNVGAILCGVALIAFVIIAGAIAFTGINTRKEVADKTIATVENVPKAWNTNGSVRVVANSSLSGEVVDSKYIQYTVSVTNANSGDGLYVTHLASYLTEDDEKGGFVPLAFNSLEYSYNPDDVSSWTKIGISAPVAADDAFKIDANLHLGTLGSSTDTIYFRFYVEPDKDAKIVNNKVSFLLRNSRDEAGYTASVATIAYENAILEAKQQLARQNANTASGDEAMDGTYADPLGMFSFIPNVDVISSVVASTMGIDQNVLVIGMIAIGAGVIVFIVCLFAYIPIARKK